jgi:hypothetical protein
MALPPQLIVLFNEAFDSAQLGPRGSLKPRVKAANWALFLNSNRG